jgi:hypothetical protein
MITKIKPITNVNQPKKRQKTSLIDPDMYTTQQDDNKHFAKQFFFQSHTYGDLILIIQGIFCQI